MNNLNTSKILVLGGTGFIGRAVCERLVAAGAQVTVPTRRARNARDIQHLSRLHVLQADVHAAGSLETLMAGHNVVINLIAILHGTAQQFDAVHVQLTERIVAACEAAKVDRLIHVSALGADRSGPSMYQQSKGRGEAVLQTAAARGMDVRIVRPSVVFGEGDSFLNLFASLQRVFPFMPLAGASAQLQPVWVGDVVDLVEKLAYAQHKDWPSSYKLNSIQKQALAVQAAGPRAYSLADLVRLSGSWSGNARPVFGIPASLGKLQALMMEWLPGEPLMSRDNLESLKTPNVAQPGVLGLQDFGITPTALEAVAPLYLKRQSQRTRLDAYRASKR
jgi:uncharacterized protein YbjT (DUF2867 family)